MSESKLPTLHLDEQYAVALLGPIGNTLDELAARLVQYETRLRLLDADRDAIARARDAINHAGQTVHALVAARRDASSDTRGK